MPRITHVNKAQQRYETVPVLDASGQPKETPVMRADGTQKTTKHGSPVFMKVTREDRTRPLPPYTCDHCQKPIAVGTPYKHMSPKSGPYGGRKLTRHASCPTWNKWDYSSSLSARISQIMHNAEQAVSSGSEFDSVDDVQQILNDTAAEIRELADEKEAAADSIEDGFGHETYQSAEIREQAEALNSWADEVESANIPDYPEPEEDDCVECNGTGSVTTDDEDDPEDCPICGGSGQVAPEEPTEEQLDDWRSEVGDALSVLQESPL